MSTRCQIKIRYCNQDILLYHHWDGYPENITRELFKAQRVKGSVKWSWNGDAIVNRLVKDNFDDGFEIAFNVHTDLDYWYELDCDRKTLRCWKVNGYLLSNIARVDMDKAEEVDLTKIKEEEGYGK